MKKKAALLVIVLIIVFGCLYFIPVNITKEANIQLNFDNTYRMMSDLMNWKNWNPAVNALYQQTSSENISTLNTNKRIKFFNARDSVLIEKINAFLFNVSGSINSKIVSYNLSISPLQSTFFTNVLLYEKKRLLHVIFPFLNRSSEGEKALTSLKSFFENSSNVYGLTIQTEKVTTDTVFAVIEAPVSKEKMFTAMQQRFALLTQYIQEKELKQTGFFSISITPRNDSVYLITGIPVNMFASPSYDIRCVNIPKGKMLTALFNGRFADRNKVYAAFQQYSKDHFLEIAGAPIESYTDNKIPSSDTSIINCKIYYPIR